MNLLEEIRSRGFWHVVVRPATFKPDRVDYAQLQSVLEGAAVRFRGWDYPHISQRSPIHRDSDWIGQEITFRHYRELWRFYQSGQLVHFSGMLEDWLPDVGAADFKAGERLGVGHTLFRMTEIFEFAARLALSPAGDDNMVVAIEFVGLEDRKLWSDKNTSLGQVVYDDLMANIPKFAIEKRLQRAELAAQSWELAAVATGELFQRFGWTDSLQVLRTEQEELRGWAESRGGLRH